MNSCNGCNVSNFESPRLTLTVRRADHLPICAAWLTIRSASSTCQGAPGQHDHLFLQVNMSGSCGSLARHLTHNATDRY